jgi:hypothetical protein
MERELGLSYPTIRGRVDALVRALGLGDAAQSDDAGDTTAASDATPSAVARRAILERLSRREISAEDAAAALRSIGA